MDLFYEAFPMFGQKFELFFFNVKNTTNDKDRQNNKNNISPLYNV